MNEIKIPFGRAADGRMISIDDPSVTRGLECNCFCAGCSARLVARKGEIKQPHFAHHVEAENCVRAGESSVHIWAKQVICDDLNSEYQLLHLPDNLDLGLMRSAISEVWLEGIRPNVLAEFNETVAIEIYFGHRVDRDKLKKIIERKLATFEIDLSSYRDVHKTEEEWRDLVLRTAPRFWLFQPAIVRERIEREAREAVEREAARQAEIQRAAERREWIAWRQQEERRQQQEWHALIAAEQKRRKTVEFAAIAQAEIERTKRLQEFLNEKERRYLAGLILCADTKRHLGVWENKKRALALRESSG